MNKSETARVLAKIQLIDNRTVDAVTVEAWHEIIGHLDYTDAIYAVTIHRQNSIDYITPAHVIGAAKQSKMIRAAQERRERALDAASTGKPAYPVDVNAYNPRRVAERYPAQFAEGRASGNADRAYWTTLRETGGDRPAAEKAKTDAYRKWIKHDVPPVPAMVIPPEPVNAGRDYTEPAERVIDDAPAPMTGTQNVVACKHCPWMTTASDDDPDAAVDDGVRHLQHKHPNADWHTDLEVRYPPAATPTNQSA